MTDDGQRPVRVLVVDNQELVRAGLRHVLRPSGGFEVAAEAGDGEGALAVLADVRVDVVVMDIRMPRLDGIGATERISRLPAAPPVLILTTFGEDEAVALALRAGAAGFALKDAPGDELQLAVRAVAQGEGWLDPAVTPGVLAGFRTAAATRADAPRPAGDRPRGLPGDLTAREADVLALLGRGLTNGEIAAALFISEATVKTHVSHVFDKLGVCDRAAAIVYAFDAGVVRPAG